MKFPGLKKEFNRYDLVVGAILFFGMRLVIEAIKTGELYIRVGHVSVTDNPGGFWLGIIIFTFVLAFIFYGLLFMKFGGDKRES